MSTKKRFYIEKISGSVWLRDGKGYVVVALPDNLQRSRIPYLQDLCDLLNKGWEAPEGETTTCCCGFCVRESQERTEEGR